MNLCMCGCGKETQPQPQTDTKRGFKKGDLRRFLRGHNLKRKRWSPISDECIVCTANNKDHWGKGMCKNCYMKAWEKTPAGKATVRRKQLSEHTKTRTHNYYLTRYKDKAKENARRWVERNPEKRKIVSINYIHTRRARMTETDITKEDIEKLKREAVNCPLCNRVLAKHGRYPDGRQLDHIIPLYRGGRHTRDNIRYICSLCNCTHR